MTQTKQPPANPGRFNVLLERVLVLAGRGSVIEVHRLETLKRTLVRAIADIDAVSD